MTREITLSSAFRWAAFIGASGALCIAGSIGLLPAWSSFLFKPLTTILIIAYAWHRGGGEPNQKRFIVAGLVLSLAGDIFLLWPKAGFLPGLVSFLLAHLMYIAAFCARIRFAARPVPFVIYALAAAGILSQLWSGIPAALRVPVLAYVACLAAMGAQAAAWWRSNATNNNARWAAIGGVLFMSSDTLLAINKFATPLPFASLWILVTYWAAQWCIASAMTATDYAITTSCK